MLSSITRREIVIGSVIQNMDKSGFDHESWIVFIEPINQTILSMHASSYQ